MFYRVKTKTSGLRGGKNIWHDITQHIISTNKHPSTHRDRTDDSWRRKREIQHYPLLGVRKRERDRKGKRTSWGKRMQHCPLLGERTRRCVWNDIQYCAYLFHKYSMYTKWISLCTEYTGNPLSLLKYAVYNRANRPLSKHNNNFYFDERESW